MEAHETAVVVGIIYNTISTITSVCPSVRPYVTKNFFRLNRLGIILGSPPDPQGWPLTPTPRPPGHAAPPEELARARRALSSQEKKDNFLKQFIFHNFTQLKLVYLKTRKGPSGLCYSSGGAACPGGRGVGVRSQPRGSGGDPKVKKNFCDVWTYGRTYGRTDVTVEIVI